MNTNSIVCLCNLKTQYKQKNLYLNAYGVVLKNLPNNKSLVIFFNDKIIGDYAIVEVNNIDLKIEKEKLPPKMFEELISSDKLSEKNLMKKQSFKKLLFNECDFVELMVEDEKYSKFQIHKGNTGVIATNSAVDNEILVDFSGIDENGQYYGDCISVNIDDIKKIEE